MKAENWLDALDSCFVLFGTLHQCAPTEPSGNRTRDLTVRKPVSNRCATSARSRLEFSISAINDIARIIFYCLVCYTCIQRNGWPRNSLLPTRWSTYCWFYTSNELITPCFLALYNQFRPFRAHQTESNQIISESGILCG